jgi:hypothetical protein
MFTSSALPLWVTLYAAVGLLSALLLHVLTKIHTLERPHSVEFILYIAMMTSLWMPIVVGSLMMCAVMQVFHRGNDRDNISSQRVRPQSFTTSTRL